MTRIKKTTVDRGGRRRASRRARHRLTLEREMLARIGQHSVWAAIVIMQALEWCDEADELYRIHARVIAGLRELDESVDCERWRTRSNLTATSSSLPSTSRDEFAGNVQPDTKEPADCCTQSGGCSKGTPQEKGDLTMKRRVQPARTRRKTRRSAPALRPRTPRTKVWDPHRHQTMPAVTLPLFEEEEERHESPPRVRHTPKHRRDRRPGPMQLELWDEGED